MIAAFDVAAIAARMALVLAFAPPAGAADGWVGEREAAGCAIESRVSSAGGGSEVDLLRATCVWPEVDPAKLASLLGQFDRYDEYIYPVTLARIERREQERTLVYQRQSFFGIPDRETLLWMRTVPRDGGTSYEWITATEEPLMLAPGAVRAPRNEGRWTVAPDLGGGSRVVHEIGLDPGGSVPDWVVRLASTRGFARILGDVRRIGGT